MDLRKLHLLLLSLCLSIGALAETAKPIRMIEGIVKDTEGNPLPAATVYIEGTTTGTATNGEGFYRLKIHAFKESNITAKFLGYESLTIKVSPQVDPKKVDFILKEESNSLQEVEVFGVRDKQPDKLDMITRMPLRPSEQIQSISVISNRLIEEQGSQTLTDAVQNVVGVNQFANFGGVQESLSARGYRGLPILKNGVRVQSDFRGGGFLMDMQGIESIQVLKGSAAVTQGIGNDLGSAGGVVNLATKTPKFVSRGNINLRGGSWGLIRPTFDVETTLNTKKNMAVRLNGAFERADNYRKHVEKDRIYVNPSLAWKANDKMTFVAEFDYMHDSRTPDKGTVNLAADSVYALYELPHDKFLGFKTDRNISNNFTYGLRGEYQINDLFSLRAAYIGSSLSTDNLGASNRVYKRGAEGYNMQQRSLGRSERDDKNSTLQIDFIGKDVYTGFIKHTFQVGVDYRTTDLTTTSYNPVQVDVIDVLKDVTNELPGNIQKLEVNKVQKSKEYAYGLLAQNVMSFTDYLKATVGVRYSYNTSTEEGSSTTTTGDAWNPVFGIIISPIKQLNIFGSYTTTTSLRSAANKMEDGSLVGSSRSDQFEVGIKSDWFDNRLRFNLTYFNIMNKNLAYQLYDEADAATGLYAKAGDLRRQGIEAELLGRLLPNLEVILGYSYLKAEYRNSPAYHEGSAPINTPSNTANAWVYYTFNRGALNGLSMGIGTYYVGKRPVNDYSYKVTHANSTPNVKPFDMPSYTTVNAQLAYSVKKVKMQVFFNNIWDKLGYTSYYRGGYINPIDPFNVSASIGYTF